MKGSKVISYRVGKHGSVATVVPEPTSVCCDGGCTAGTEYARAEYAVVVGDDGEENLAVTEALRAEMAVG